MFNVKGVENMKKIWTILILLMMLISITSFAIADDEAGEGTENEQDEEIDEETQQEIKAMNTPLGAEIRLLQLKKALLINILKAEMAIEVLKSLEFGEEDLSALEDILDDMKDLYEVINGIDPTSEDAVQAFVENKSLAINLTKEFRDTIKDLLDEVDLNALREQIKAMISEEVLSIGKYIHSRIRQFNRNQLYRLYGLIGEVDNDFIEQYLNETVTLGQAKLQICKIINQMTRERKFNIFSELKEENIKNKINAEAFMDQMHGKGKGKGRSG